MTYPKIILVGPCQFSKISRSALSKKNFLIFIDGGLKYQKKFPSHNWISIGDQDSSKSKLDIQLKKDKDASDLHFALKLIPKKIKYIESYGLFSDLKNEQRFDHRLCNLGEFYHYSKKNKTYFKLNENEMILPAGKHALNINSLFSILVFEKTYLEIKGKVRFPLLKPSLIKTFSSLTLSNKATGKIYIQNSKPILILAQKKIRLDKNISRYS